MKWLCNFFLKHTGCYFVFILLGQLSSMLPQWVRFLTLADKAQTNLFKFYRDKDWNQWVLVFGKPLTSHSAGFHQPLACFRKSPLQISSDANANLLRICYIAAQLQMVADCCHLQLWSRSQGGHMTSNWNSATLSGQIRKSKSYNMPFIISAFHKGTSCVFYLLHSCTSDTSTTVRTTCTTLFWVMSSQTWL